VTNLERSQAKASQLVKSGKFHGWSPIAFELRFEDGFEEAREYVGEQGRPFLKGQKNDFRDAEAVAEAVQRPTMRFVPTKSVDQLDLQALHRVRSRLVGQRTAIVNQIRAFLLERGIAVRQGLRFLRHALPDILANRVDVLTPRMVHMIEGLAGDLRADIHHGPEPKLHKQAGYISARPTSPSLKAPCDARPVHTDFVQNHRATPRVHVCYWHLAGKATLKNRSALGPKRKSAKGKLVNFNPVISNSKAEIGRHNPLALEIRRYSHKESIRATEHAQD
jgi:hypothetical protein